MMKDMGHRSRVELALKLKEPDHVPVNNFANITPVKSANSTMGKVRFDAEKSAEMALRYARMTHSDFVFPQMDINMMYADLGIEVKQPDDNYSSVISELIKDPEDLDRMELYDAFDNRVCPNFVRAIVNKVSAVVERADEDYHIAGISWGPFTVAGHLRGTEKLMMDTFADPEFVSKLVKKTAKWAGSLEKRCMQAGATHFWMPDPTSSEDLVSADTYKQFVYEPVKAMIHDLKMEYKAPFIMHICGDTTNTMKLLPEVGVDCFSVDHKVDIAKAKKAIGKKIAIMGNVHPIEIALNGTPANVTKASIACIEKAGKGGGLILSTGCETPMDCPDANIIAMGKAALEHGKYPLK
jgi:uroporphyrinogen decarboxylase